MEILFKAKRKDTKEWVEGSCVWFDENQCFILPVFDRASTFSYSQIFSLYAVPVEAYTVCQYVKQNDKYGKPIFENDIVTIENTKKQGLPGVIVYNRLSASFELAREGYNSIRLDYFEDGKSEFVVIGNIHDKGE